jgi:hypothetical protein
MRKTIGAGDSEYTRGRAISAATVSISFGSPARVSAPVEVLDVSGGRIAFESFALDAEAADAFLDAPAVGATLREVLSNALAADVRRAVKREKPAGELAKEAIRAAVAQEVAAEEAVRLAALQQKSADARDGKGPAPTEAERAALRLSSAEFLAVLTRIKAQELTARAPARLAELQAEASRG